MAPQSIFLLALSSALLLARAHAYCTPDASCWPTDSDWDGLRAKLTATASLRKLNTDDYTAEYSKCRDFGFSSSAAVSLQGTDVCLQHHDCLFEKCDNSGNRGVPNMPEYMLEARTPVDIQEGIRFANQFDIPVSPVKNTGHSYQGSSYGRGTLSICAGCPACSPACVCVCVCVQARQPPQVQHSGNELDQHLLRLRRGHAGRAQGRRRRDVGRCPATLLALTTTWWAAGDSRWALRAGGCKAWACPR